LAVDSFLSGSPKNLKIGTRGLSSTEIAAFHRQALALADLARRTINKELRRGPRIERKPDGTWVTSTDRAVERALRERLARRYPDHGVLGEEFPPAHPGAAFQWILDPIDGTEEFVHGIPTFGSIIALHHRGRPLVGVIDFPALGLRVHAARGIGCFRNDRRVRLGAPESRQASRLRIGLSARANFTRHSNDGQLFDRVARAFPNHRTYRSCLAHALAVTGALDVTVEWDERAWDLAAAEVLVTEAGGSYVVVRERDAGGAPVTSAVFGRAAAVARVHALLNPSGGRPLLRRRAPARRSGRGWKRSGGRKP
jgi:fructose-1,6-bisphosphatase/inositol monophosphatase family enzyme